MKAPDFSRLDRVAATVQRVLGNPVSALARSAGADMASITRVAVAPDMRRATVFISIYGADKPALLKAISASAHELQRVLGRELRTRRTPVLAFRLDDGMEQGDRINRLLGSTAPGASEH